MTCAPFFVLHGRMFPVSLRCHEKPGAIAFMRDQMNKAFATELAERPVTTSVLDEIKAGYRMRHQRLLREQTT